MAKKSTISALTTVAYSIVFVVLAISAIVLVQIAAFGVGQRDQAITGLHVFSSGVEDNVLDINQYEDQLVTEITMQIKGIDLPEEGESGYVDYSSHKIKISVRTAQNEIWTNSSTRPADIKIGTAETGSVSGEVGINENFTLILRTHQENNAAGEATDYLIGGTCYIYAYTTDGAYVSEPLAVNIDVPVESISVVVFDYKSDNITNAVSNEENPQMFIQGDQLQLGITAIPSNSLQPIVGRASKLANFRFTDGTNDDEATLTEQGRFTVVGDAPFTTGSHEIKARIAKHFGVSGEGEKNFVESEVLTIRTAPVELEDILIGNTAIVNNGLSINVGANGKLTLSALSGISGAQALQLSLRSKHYTNGVDPLADGTKQLELEIVQNFSGGTDPRTNFATLYRNAVVRNSQSVSGSNVIWEIEAYRSLVTGEKLQLCIKHPTYYQSTYMLVGGKVIINGVEYQYSDGKLFSEPDFNGSEEGNGYSVSGNSVTIGTTTYTISGNRVTIGGVEYIYTPGTSKLSSEPDFNANGWGNGYTVSDNIVTVETGCIYIDLNVRTVLPTGFAYSNSETNLEITKVTNAAGEESLYQEVNYNLADFVTWTNKSATTYSKWVYFKESASTNKNAVGSDIVDLSTTGQLQISDVAETYLYSSKIAAKGGGEVNIRAYMIRTDAAGNPLNYNYQPLTVGDATGFMLESDTYTESSDSNKFVVVFVAPTVHTVKVSERLTEMKFFEDAALTQPMMADSYIIGTGLDNSKIIYARANPAFALLEYYKPTGSNRLRTEVLDVLTQTELPLDCEITLENSENSYYLKLEIFATQVANFDIVFKQGEIAKGSIRFDAQNIEITGVEVDFSGLGFDPTGGSHILDGANSVTINGIKYVYDAVSGFMYNTSAEANFNGNGYSIVGNSVTVKEGEDAGTHTIENNKVTIGVEYLYNPITKKLFRNGIEADFNGTGYTVNSTGTPITVTVDGVTHEIIDNEVTLDDKIYIYSSTDAKLYCLADFGGKEYEVSTTAGGTRLVIDSGVKTLSVYRALSSDGGGEYADSGYNTEWTLPSEVIYHLSAEHQELGLNPSFPGVERTIYIADSSSLAGFAGSTTPIAFGVLASGSAYVGINGNKLAFSQDPKNLPAGKVLIIVYSAGTNDGSLARSDWFVLDIHYP